MSRAEVLAWVERVEERMREVFSRQIPARIERDNPEGAAALRALPDPADGFRAWMLALARSSVAEAGPMVEESRYWIDSHIDRPFRGFYRYDGMRNPAGALRVGSWLIAAIEQCDDSADGLVLQDELKESCPGKWMEWTPTNE